MIESDRNGTGYKL